MCLIMVSSRHRNVVFTALTFITRVYINKAETKHSKSNYHVYGEHGVFTKYRPISILPAFSKNFEKVIYNRFLNFLHKYNIHSDSQYGSEKYHSTVFALTHLCDKVSSSSDNKQYTVGIFID